MYPLLNGRSGHYVLLAALGSVMFLVNLGGPTLWDIDEGNNAEAAREMMERGEWVVPTFNFELRTDKPALLYWLQIGAYRLCGVNETAARLPSALAAILTVLFVYELGRILFGAGAGLLAGVILASTIMFGAAAHFANPDALLSFFNTLTLLLFWRSYARSGRGWFIPAGMCAGLAMLAKGPVGLVLPAAVVLLFLLWERRLLLLWDTRLPMAVLAFLVVAAPWYAMVGADTKGEFLRGFFLTHNLGRFQASMENHGGPIFYYIMVLGLGFAPWSVFLGPVGWYGLKSLRSQGPVQNGIRPAFRFLWCWIGVYLVFFSFARTKLPNYILPLYPAAALLTARFLDGWRRGEFQPASWVLKVGLVCLALCGAGLSMGTLIASGVIPLAVMRGRFLPGLGAFAGLGLVCIIGAGAAWWYLQRQRRTTFIVIVAGTAALFIGTLAAWAGPAMNEFKAPQMIAATVASHRTEREIRIGSYQYFQPSLVFYSRREVRPMDKEPDALEFLASPLCVYLIVPWPVWDALEAKARTFHRVIGRQRDFYRHCDVVIVCNR